MGSDAQLTLGIFTRKCAGDFWKEYPGAGKVCFVNGDSAVEEVYGRRTSITSHKTTQISGVSDTPT